MRFEGFEDVTPVLRSGVYILCAKGVVIYVGKSKKMVSRIDNHRSVWAEKRKGKASWLYEQLGIPGILFDEVHVRPCPAEDLDRLEREMIDRYRPKYNQMLRKTGPIRAPITLNIRGLTIPLNAAAQPQQPRFERRV